MIVFDLRCTGGHVFEAWFASTAAYDEQRGQALIACPLCGDTGIEKAVMAPNIAPKGGGTPSPETMKAARALLAKAQRQALKGSEWVGSAFAARARDMHSGAADPAPIHGQATRAEAKALAEDGVPIVPLPLPIVPPDRAN